MEKIENIFRIVTKEIGNRVGTVGWQFKMKRNGKQETKLFSDSVFGGTEAALQAAIEYKSKRLEDAGLFHGVTLSDKISLKNTTGIIGVHRTESIRNKDARIETVWQSHSPTVSGKNSNKSFSVPYYGEMGALKLAVQKRLNDISLLIGTEKYIHCESIIKNLVDKYLNILVYLESIKPTEEEFLISIIKDKGVSGTDKEKIITGRVGQSSYKEKLLKLWNHACCVTGSKIMLQASHIKPWSVSSDAERLDPFNGLLLSPWYDKAFDNGYISFSDNGKIILSKFILSDPISEVIEVKNIHIKTNEFNARYLNYHRENIFKG